MLVTALTLTDRVEHTYNLSVADWHTFMVGEDRVVVHNVNCGKAIRSLEKRIAEHRAKLVAFRANPTVRPGMEKLPPDVIRAAQQSRIEHLEREIRAWEDAIERLKGR